MAQPVEPRTPCAEMDGYSEPGFCARCVTFFLLLVVLPALAVPSADAQTPTGADSVTLALVGGTLIDGNEGPPLEDAVVLVAGERIVHVGTVADTEVPDAARVVDTDGYTVMPGLHDAHVHTMIVGHGVYDEFFPAYGDRLREVMPISARQLLRSGVTSARDLGAPLEDAMWLKRQIEDDAIEGPRIFVSGPFLQASLPAGAGRSYDSRVQGIFRWPVEGAEDASAKTRQLIDAGVDIIKVIQLGGLTEAERTAIADEAASAGLPVVVHAWTADEVEMAAAMGAASIEHVGAGHAERYPEASVRAMADAGIVAVPTALVNRVVDLTIEYPERLDDPRLREDLPADLYRDVRESLRFFTRLDYFEGDVGDAVHSREKIAQLHEAGVGLAIGTDSGTPMNFHYESTWQEMDLFVRAGIPPMDVITMATRDAARLSRVGEELGTVDPGKLADLIVVDGNPLVDMRAVSPERIVHVIKGGEVVR